MKKSFKITLLTFFIAMLIPLLSSTVFSFEDSPSSQEINQTPMVDGIISTGEYEYNSLFSGGDFILYWTVFNDEIYFGMVGQALGYVALGFEPSFMMKDADMIIGWVFANTTVNVTDTYSTGNTGPHPPDVFLGGTSDLLVSAGTEDLSSTTIEFSRLLVTGDEYDVELSTDNSVNVIWALSNVDDFDAGHSARGSGSINLSEGTSQDTTPPPLWIYHAILMVLGFLLLTAGIVIARFYKTKKWRLKAHRYLNLSASIVSISGITLSFVMVSEHFRIVHHFFGVIALPFFVLMPLFGYLFTNNLQNIPLLNKLNPYRKYMRKIHRWFGYLTYLLMIGSIITGLIRVF